VLGAYATTIESFLVGLPRISIAINTSWQEGQASSLRKGLELARKSKPEAALIMLADQPMIDTDSIGKLLDRFDETHRIVASHYNVALGAPAIFGAEFFDQLQDLTGDHGAGAWLRSNKEAVTAVRMDEAAVDIDTPDDLKELHT